MNVLFVSLGEINNISEHGLYSDLLREFSKNNHSLTIVSPVEKRTGRKGEVVQLDDVRIIKVRIGNIQKTNYIEKTISTLCLPYQLIKAIKTFCNSEKFDLILYATPPITIYKLIKHLKKITKARTFLLLKDIWPQEIVDLGLIRENGMVYKYFSNLERKIYNISDKIGYTSLANKKYLINLGIDEEKLVEVNNSVDPNYHSNFYFDRHEFRNKYAISDDSIVFFYGGNLGKPQDIDFFINCLETQIEKENRFFVVCGQGTEYKKIEAFFDKNKPSNMKLFPFLPKDEYDELIMGADVGMVFLNHNFTVPNCPCRFYTYMEYSTPIFACTDTATDIKEDIFEGNFGWWCESSKVEDFIKMVDLICEEDLSCLAERGRNARLFLEERYTVDKDYERIINSIKTN